MKWAVLPGMGVIHQLMAWLEQNDFSPSLRVGVLLPLPEDIESSFWISTKTLGFDGFLTSLTLEEIVRPSGFQSQTESKPFAILCQRL